MGHGIYSALSGAVAQSKALDVVAHDVANAGTVGFRAERASFQEALQGAQDRRTPSVVVRAIAEDRSQGSLRNTGEPLDLAIKGDGYFAIGTASGVRYTRAGAFHLDSQGTIVTPEGAPLLDQNGASMSVPPGAEVRVAGDGTVEAGGGEIGRIGLGLFRPEDLLREGNHFVLKGGAVASEGGAGEIVSGALEESNFSVVRGMIDLVRVSRNYETLTRMIQGYKEIDDRTARDMGR
jgi:flagellar basal-body rod protein FlgF